MSEQPHVVVTAHAIQRARQRCTGMVGHEKTLARIAREAISEDRRSKRCPDWAARKHVPRQLRGAIRFLWDADDTVCLVVRRSRSRGRAAWLVVTVLGAGDPEQLAATRLLHRELRG